MMQMYRKLESDKISGNINVLSKRISERFPDSGLSKVCKELLTASEEADKNCILIGKPNIILRFFMLIIAILIFGLLTKTLLYLKLPGGTFTIAEFIQVLEASLNGVVLIGAAIIFLVTIETRVKRSRSTRSINELRALAHVIDMHQLTKDPHRIHVKGDFTSSSPRIELTSFELARYLSYCIEMLSLTGKVAALYAQNINDSIVLASVNELEALTTGLCRKIWQKIMILDYYKND